MHTHTHTHTHKLTHTSTPARDGIEILETPLSRSVSQTTAYESSILYSDLLKIKKIVLIDILLWCFASGYIVFLNQKIVFS